MPSKQSIGEKKLSCLDRDSNTQLHTCRIQPRVLAFIAGMIVFRVDPSLLHLRVSMLPTLWRYIHGLFNHKLWSYIHVWFNSRFVSSCDIMCNGACDIYRRLLTFFMYMYVHVLIIILHCSPRGNEAYEGSSFSRSFIAALDQNRDVNRLCSEILDSKILFPCKLLFMKSAILQGKTLNYLPKIQFKPGSHTYT